MAGSTHEDTDQGRSIQHLIIKMMRPKLLSIRHCHSFLHVELAMKAIKHGRRLTGFSDRIGAPEQQSPFVGGRGGVTRVIFFGADINCRKRCSWSMVSAQLDCLLSNSAVSVSPRSAVIHLPVPVLDSRLFSFVPFSASPELLLL